MHALVARGAALNGQQDEAASFLTTVLGLTNSPRWIEAGTTALLGNWADPLYQGGSLDSSALVQIKTEAHAIHRSLTPLWRRRHNGRRVLLLESPCGENTTLRDLLASASGPEELLFDSIPADPRLSAILTALAPTERSVLLALGTPGVTSWAEAAELAGAQDPPAFGERVRRKARRLAAEQRRRAAQRYPTSEDQLWQHEQEGTSS
ncbi:hypothetical protein ABZ502_29945 [Streptomyces abikoensis]|uniref:hypothetical protein n=1 Tax=Streptomyces abikoensis TaxID=97398 RepID=UPI0033E77DB4